MAQNEVKFRLAVEGASKVNSDFKAVAGEIQRTATVAGDLTRGLFRLAAAAGIGLSAREFIQQADAMALLDARLKNAAGSGEQFAASQRAIFEIAQQNNIGLQETTQLYIKLADPVQRLGGTTAEVAGITNAFALSLRVGGASAEEAASATLQFAQAMGSGKLQGDEFRSMAEASPRFLKALADGMGQPIEKLKEMGSEGKLTADVVGNALLQSLGQLKTEAESLPDTLGGALTRLQNEALLAVVAFNDMTGSAGTVADTVGLAAQWIGEMTSAVRALDAGTKGLNGTVDLAAVGFGAIGTVLETVVLIASDVSFVLTSIGREIGGIAAQAAAILRGDFAQAGAIRDEMVADAARHRAELDKFQASVGGATARILEQRNAVKDSTAETVRAATGFRSLKSAVSDTEAAQKASTKAAKELNKALDEYEKVRVASLKTGAQTIEGMDRELQSLKDRYVEMTAGKEVLDQLVNLRLEDAAAAHEQMAAAGEREAEIAQQRMMAERLREQIALRRGIAAAAGGKEPEQANTRAADRAVDDWQRASDQIGQSLADALMQGGKSAGEYIKGLFRTMVLKPIIQAIVQPAANSVLQLLGQGGSGGGALNTASSLSSIYNTGAKGYNWLTGSTAGSQFVSGYNYGGLLASGAGGAGGATISGGGAGSIAAADSVYAGATTTTAGTAGSAVGSAASWLSTWGAAIAAGVYKANADWNEGYRRDQAKDVSDGVSDSLGGGVLGKIAGWKFTGGAESEIANLFSKLGMSDKMADLFSGSTAVAKLFGRAAPRITGSGIQGTLGGGDFTGEAYADIYEKGGLFRKGKSYQQFAEIPEEIGRMLDGAASGVLDKAKEYGAALGLPTEALAGITADLKVQLGEDAEANKEALMTALGGYGDALVAGWADAVKPLAAYGETTIQTIERVAGAILGINNMLERIGATALSTTVDGGKAAQALADAFGGLDNLGNAVGAYYDQFFSEQEKAEQLTKAVTAAFAEYGEAVPTTREAFKELVATRELETEAGREQFHALMSVADAFAYLTPAAEDAAEKIRKMAEVFDGAMASLDSERGGLQVDYLRAAGFESDARAEERSQYLAGFDVSDEQRAAIAAAYDYNQALRDQIDALGLASKVAEEKAEKDAAIAAEQAGLELQRLGLLGDTAAIRELERNALDESNRALYDQIKALEDQAEAADKAAVAAKRLAEAEERMNAPITQANINASAQALQQRQLFGSTDDIIARITGGAYGANYASEFARMTGYGPQGASPEFTAMQRQLFINGAMVADAMAKAQPNPVNRKATRGGGSDGSDYMDKQRELLSDQLDSTIDLIDSLEALRRGIGDFRDDLLGSALDPSNPAEKYAAEKALAESLGKQALTGDAAAIAAFEQQARTFLDISQSYNASTPAYADDFNRMITLLAEIEARLSQQQATATATLRVQQDGLGQIAGNTSATAEATSTQARSARVLEQRGIE